MVMSKDDKNDFLLNGGKFIRKAIDRYGCPIIKEKTKEKDWHPLIKFTSVRQRDICFRSLLHNPEIKEE